MPSLPEPPERGVNRRGLLIGGGAAVGVLALGAVIAALDSSSGTGSPSGSASASAKPLGALAAPQLLIPKPIGAVTAADVLGAESAPVVAVSPDGELVAVGYVRNEANTAAGGFVQVWRVSDGKWVAAAEIPDYGALTLAFSPDGRTLAISAVYQVLLWNLDSATAPVKAPGIVNVYESPTAIAFSPDAKTLAAANRQELTCSSRVQLWSVSGTTATDSSSLSVGCDDAEAFVTNFLFSPDATMAAAGVMALDATSCQLTTWELGSGKQINRSVPHGGTEDALSVAFSPDGKSIVTTCTEVQIWDAEGSGGPRATWTAPKADDVSSFIDVQYSHSGEYIVVVGINGVPYLLSAKSGKLLATLSMGSLAVTSVRFLAKDAGIACCGTGIADSKPRAWLSRFA